MHELKSFSFINPLLVSLYAHVPAIKRRCLDILGPLIPPKALRKAPAVVTIRAMLARLQGAVVVLVDMQPTFLRPIDGGERVLQRCSFMIEIAHMLGVPIIATEQYPYRMGGTDERLLPLLKSAEVAPIAKMSFGCAGSSEFMEQLGSRSPEQVVLIGIESHICVAQTALQLIERGVSVMIGADAVGARPPDMHPIGIERMRGAGATITHTESIAYEWLQTAENPRFRDALAIVKKYA